MEGLVTLLAAPTADTIKSKRDRAILSTLLFHALRREELCKLKVKDAGTRAKACRISRCEVSPIGWTGIGVT